MRNKSASPDGRVAEIAAGQHGVISTAQLVAAGLTRAGIGRRVRAGRLHAIHRGVYAVGHRALSNEGRWKAAELACGEGAAVSHRDAAELFGFLRPRGAGFPVHVTIPVRTGRKQQRGICLHKSPSVQSVTVVHNGIAVTSAARTIADLRAVASVDEVRRAIREAEYREYDVSGERQKEEDLTRSWLERRFKAMCSRHRLPLPEVNAYVGPHEVDFLWRDAKLVVEADGWDTHKGRQAFEDDRAKDAEVRALGFTVQRFTHRQITQRWAWVERHVRALL
jgi:very-short-patch-repair endonuclease